MSGGIESARSTRRELAIATLELAALTGAAIAQPLLDVFGKAPDVFIRAGVTGADIVVFALVVALGPLLVLVAVEAVVAATAGEGPRRVVHRVFVGALVLLLALHALRSIFGWEGTWLLVVALAIAAVFGVAHARSHSAREWLRWAAVLPVVVVVLFLVVSPVADLVRTSPASASAQVTVKSRRSVVVLLLDEFPVLSLLDAEGRIDRHRAPNFARLAAEGTWFRNTTSAGTHTLFAMPAVMTGRYPTDHASDVPTYAEYPDSIFRLLGGVYPVNASEVMTRLCAPSYCHPPRATSSAQPESARASEGLPTVLSRARRAYEEIVALHDARRVAEGDAVEAIGTPTTTPLTAAAKDPTVAGTIPTSQQKAAFANAMPPAQPTRFADWLARITPGGPPTLHLAHFLLPHYPWLHTAGGRSYVTPDSGAALPGYSNGTWDTEPGAELARRRHLLQVGYVDRLLGTLVARLKATHHWDDTVFVVTADHGVAFTAGSSMRELDDVNRDEILGVPLFVHAPGMKSGIDDRPAQNIDVVPTVAGLLGVRIPWHVDGRDLSRPPSPRPAAHPVGVGKDLDPSLHVQTVELGDHIPRLREQARSSAVPFASTDPDLSVLRSGPHGALIGRSITDFATNGDAEGRRWRREYPDDAAFEHVDVDVAVPAYVTGRLENAEPDDAIVGVVNGRVAGVGVIVEPGDRPLVAMVLQPASFRPGANDVRFFRYLDDQTLAPL